MQAEPPFPQPPQQRLPFVPATAGEDPLPEYIAPIREEVPELALPKLSLPEVPVPPPCPPAYEPGEPKYGEDWTGERPRYLPLPVYSGPAAEEEPGLDLPTCPGAPPKLVRHSLRSFATLSTVV
jgi:hypothetical protein